VGVGNKNPATTSCEDMVVSITCLSHPSRKGEVFVDLTVNIIHCTWYIWIISTEICVHYTQDTTI